MSHVLDEFGADALAQLPLFPLPGTVLVPRTFIALHVFEPRYRDMMEAVIDGPRLLAVAMLDDEGLPDGHGRPPVFKTAGLGALRRAARLPDGRYNLVLEGMGRIDITNEHPPLHSYRTAEANWLDEIPASASPELALDLTSLRSLCTGLLGSSDHVDSDVLEGLAALDEPGQLADLIAAAAIEDHRERQHILAELDVHARIRRVVSALGSMLIEQYSEAPEASLGWGITTGQA